MLMSIAYILLAGMGAGWLCKKIKFPALFGMILAGIAMGPYGMNLIDVSVLNNSADIRKIALIIILLRAGLKLSLDDLKRAGRPALLMCFVPATVELLGTLLLAPALLHISILEAAILGAVIAAVSPAVVVPRMIRLIDEGYGKMHAIPQMILAGASVDDVYVIVLFTTFTGLAQGDGVQIRKFINIPISIVTGIAGGLAVGFLLYYYFEKIQMRDTVKLLIVLSIAFVLTRLETQLSDIIPFASLIAVMSIGMMMRRQKKELARALARKYDKMWVGAEVFLFVLVGASVAVDSIAQAGISAVVLVFGVLIFRMAGVYLCMIGTQLDRKEKLFCMLAYTPKATVQAAIGGIPLAMGLPCGQIVLMVSVAAILVTAPLGAFAMDLSYRKLLEK